MKRYVGKSSRATKKSAANAARDPAWYGSSEEHSRAAKRGVRRKKAAKAAASVRSKQGWLTRYQEEVSAIRAKRRQTRKDVQRLKELAAKIREQKASLSHKRPLKKKRPPPAVTKPARKVPRKPTRRELALAEQARQEAKRERAKRRRRELAEARRLERERLAFEEAERAERAATRRRERAEARRLERERLEQAEAERKERERAQLEELERLRKFEQTELQRRQQATLDAAAMLDELKKVYGNRVPPEGEMIGIADRVDLLLREIYAIFHGSPEIFAA